MRGLLTVLMPMLLLGCASPNVNPVLPLDHTGYVDLFSDFPSRLSWDVQRFDIKTQKFKKVFYDLDVLEDQILRLAFKPGQYQLRVTFLNQTVIQPAVFEIEVCEREITPVQIKLNGSGVASVQTKQTSRGGTAYGRYGRRTEIGSYQTSLYGLSAMSLPFEPYKRKEQMPYAR